VIRALRQRQRKRQRDVAHAAGCSITTVSRLERGEWRSLAFGRIQGIAAVLEVGLEIRPHLHGAGLDRVLDESHAQLLGRVARLLEGWGWETRIEVTFSEFGERGSIDLLAWHPHTATLAVFEIKSELGSVEGLLRPLGTKARLAAKIARKQFGWRAARIGAIVVLPESAAVRRQVTRHETVLRAALPAGSRAVRTWLRGPSGALRGIWFLSDSHAAVPNRNPSAIQRVRTNRRC
jgi:transcriptional regulator with XRE-family HTH domain